MYDDMKSSGTPFKQSYKDYHPKFPSGFEADEKKGPALLRIYERLVLKDPRVRDSFVMGTVDIDVDRERAYTLAETKDDQSPPADFKHKGLIGIILISVYGKNGVILLDVEDLGPKFSAEVVMEVDKDLKDMPKYASSSKFYQKTRKLYTGTPNYIIVQIHGKNDVHCKEVPERFDVIYTKRSLCSMVETIEKGALLNTVRTMATFKNELDDVHHKSLMIKTAAYVTVDFKTKAVRLYTDTTDKNYEAITTLEQGNVYIQLSDFGYSGTVTQLQGHYIQAVQERMNTKDLKSKLDRLFEALGNAEFMKGFLKAHEEYYLSLHKKSSILKKIKNTIKP